MAPNAHSLVARALIAIGAWLVMAAVVLSHTQMSQSTTNLMVSGTTRPAFVRPVASNKQGVRRGNVVMRAQFPGSEEEADVPVMEAAVGATALGMAAAAAETQNVIPMPMAATCLTATLLAIIVYFFNQFNRPGPDFALAGGSVPKYDNDEEMDLAEMAAKPMQMAGRGGSKGEQLITVDKPLGLQLGEKSKSGGVYVKFVNPLGNAAKAGIKIGDTVVYTSSFFGDELWPADKLTFTQSAVTACPNAVDFIVARGPAADEINVKRLPKRPAPPKMGRKLTAAQKARATHICLDCGFIYYLPQPFEEAPNSYRCPQCQSPKSRFAKFDIETGKVESKGLPTNILTGLVGGLGVVGLLAYIATAL